MRRKGQREIELSVLLYRKGFAVGDISTLIGMCPNTIRSYLHAYGELKDGQKPRKSTASITPEIRRFVECYTVRDIQPPPQFPKRMKYVRRTPEEVVIPACHPRIYEMAKAGFTVGDIAAALGISMSECSRRVRQHIAYVKMKDIVKKG